MFNCTLEINKTDARVANTAFLSPLYQSLLSVTEKKIIKKCLKEWVEKYEEAVLKLKASQRC